MAPITVSVGVARPQAEVFSYVTDPSRFAEWQEGVVAGSIEGDNPPRSARSARRRAASVARNERPRQKSRRRSLDGWAVHGIDGPIRATVDVAVTPLATGERSRVAITLDFEGRGIGTLLVPLVVRRQARKEMPAKRSATQQRLEAGVRASASSP